MKFWTVLVRNGPETLDSHNLEAEFASWSDDGKFLEFHNASPLVDLIPLLRAADSERKYSDEEVEEMAHRLIRAFSGFKVAAFKSEVVAAYYQGTSADPLGASHR